MSMIILVICAAPAFLHLSYARDPFFYSNCTESVTEIFDCGAADFASLSSDNLVDTDLKGFVECLGWQMTSPFVYCTPSYTSLLPQIGLFNTLSLTMFSDIVFHSEPSSFAKDTFVPMLRAAGADCSGNRCQFEYARQLYSESLGWMALGAVILLIIGVCAASSLVFPNSLVLRARHRIMGLFACCRKNQKTLVEEDVGGELPEVAEEKQNVSSIVRPILSPSEDIESDDSIPVLSYEAKSDKDDLPAVLMYKLRKVFPALGGAPAKVALDSLDLHVPHGQVLGLLGKNGAGKTTGE